MDIQKSNGAADIVEAEMLVEEKKEEFDRLTAEDHIFEAPPT